MCQDAKWVAKYEVAITTPKGEERTLYVADYQKRASIDGVKQLGYRDEGGEWHKVPILSFTARVADNFRKRGEYKRGKKLMLLSMEIGQSIYLPFIDETNFGGWRSQCCKYSKCTGYIWSLHQCKEENTITIRREK